MWQDVGEVHGGKLKLRLKQGHGDSVNPRNFRLVRVLSFMQNMG